MCSLTLGKSFGIFCHCHFYCQILDKKRLKELIRFRKYENYSVQSESYAAKSWRILKTDLIDFHNTGGE